MKRLLLIIVVCMTLMAGVAYADSSIMFGSSANITSLTNKTCRIDAAGDGSEFLWIDGLDLSGYASLTPRARISISDGTKWIVGYAGDVGGGETVGSEKLLNNSFTDTWTDDIPNDWLLGGPKNDSNYIVSDDPGDRLQLVSDGSSMGIYQFPSGTVQSELCRVELTVDSITAGYWVYLGFGNGIGSVYGRVTTAGTHTSYQCVDTDRNIYLNRLSGYSCDAWISNTSVKRVTDCPATGLHIYTSATGATRGWLRKDSGFDYNKTTLRLIIESQ